MFVCHHSSCSGRTFTCTSNVCNAVCGIYGDGHYITFDDKRFDFSGECEYTLLQDYCSPGQGNGSFSIITENVPCGTTGTTCSKTIKIFLEDNEFHLKDDSFHVIKGNINVLPGSVQKMGVYLVVTVHSGLVVMWDQKTSLFISLSPQFQGEVCGLCGNYDGNSKNDFTTRSQETVTDVLEFGNSWKVSSSCSNAQLLSDPCASNRYRAAWSQKQCSIITSDTFHSCHAKVDPGPYYDSCVRDSCACDTGGDCECFCTAVAAYAKACSTAGACVRWRTPKLCPIFCDYYNSHGGCEWHYKPCGADCMKTCRNPSGNCAKLITHMEGCYPQCSHTKPFFDEDSMKCVSWDQCGCYDDKGIHYSTGEKVPSNSSCTCTINGKTYNYGATIYNTSDGLGNCIAAECGANGTISRSMYTCMNTTTAGPTTTPFKFSTEGPITSTQRATTESVETTFSETTVKIGTTNPSKVGTTGPVTGSITEVVESTTEVPGIISTSPETTLVTSKPSVVTKTTATPSRTTGAITTKASEASTTQGSSTNVGTRKPIEATSGPLTFSTTAIVEMTSSVPEGTSRKSETTTISSKPSLHTTTTEGPVTSTQRATTESVETTFSETTVKIGTTNPSKVGTTGPINVTVPLSTSRTSIPTPTTSSIFQSLPTHHRSTTSFFPSISTQVFPLRTTRVTIQTESPRISPLVTSSETTFAVITGQLHTSSVLTNPSIKITTGLTTESPVTATTVIAPMTKTLPGSTTIYPPTSTTHTTGATFPSTSQFTTASCVCNINGTSHLPGDLLYNVTDGLGWCYSAYCNASCKVETQSSPCPTTSMSSTTARSSTSLLSSTTKAPSSSSGPLTTVTTVASTATLECSDVYPPRKNGESWNTSNCTTATCVEGKVTVTATVCPNVTLPICTNGRKPVKIYEQNGCCFHYECECKFKIESFRNNLPAYKKLYGVCNVWSGSNYMTFDGQMYNFQQNCSYYLVKEIISKYNLTITRSNICDPSDSTFCPLALSVTYQSVKVYVNQKRVYPAYSNSVMLLYGTDMEITAVIQDINTKIVYRGSSFSIDLPYSLFGGNTEGQCGTCDNSQANDCRSPNGQIESCSESAGLWTVPGTSCVSPSVPSVTATAQPLTSSSQHPNPTTQPTCKPAICELLMSSLFTPCHSFISPSPFVSSCTYEICNGGNDTCSSLEAYAAECSKAGVCIDWRSDTNGLCEHRCPNNKVYMACGPLVEPTCNDRYNKMFQADVTSSANYTQEGCFCPQGTTLFNTVYDTCVASCDCVGPDGKPKQPGETWTSECSSCECDQDSMSVRCEPVTCPEVQEPNCSEPGQQLTNTTQGCCTTQTCECNLNLCAGPSACPLGFQLHVSNRTCCPSYECVPKGVCVYDMTEFQPGTKIPTPQTITEAPLEEVSIAAAPSGTGGGGQEESFIPAACQECYCGPDTHPTTKLNVITCTPVVCHTNCSEGFEYQPAAGQCCGSCVQKSCILTTSGNNTVQIIEVNNTFVPPGDKCVQYTCEEINGQILMKETKTICPPFNPLDCEPVSSSDVDKLSCLISLGRWWQRKKKTKNLSNNKKLGLMDSLLETQKDTLNISHCLGHCGKLKRPTPLAAAQPVSFHILHGGRHELQHRTQNTQHTAQNTQHSTKHSTEHTTLGTRVYDELWCVPGRLQSVCQVESQQIRVEVNHCVSAMPNKFGGRGAILNGEQVETMRLEADAVIVCVGFCRYSAAANSMMHQCECCQEATTSRKQVELTCADGSTLQHSYSHVESCRCRTETCSAGATTRAQRRRKR
ncbi:hypothetical protein CCH79_00018027 [Gambusia affinis]|uniref:VWFD domain-containing protein n=1 Tax=Gambusia affinis TaxID=33528 RepID=A0A315WAL3_GAMAF|nr:hypothetical protein CCH79_00018027 [Gambusia affinis]